MPKIERSDPILLGQDHFQNRTAEAPMFSDYTPRSTDGRTTAAASSPSSTRHHLARNAVRKQNTEKNKFYYAATQRADQSEADCIRSATGAEWDPKPMIESYHHAFSRQTERKIQGKFEESTNIEV